MGGTKTSGNRTGKRGSRYIQRFQIDRQTAQTFKLLVIQRGWEYTSEHVAKIAAELAETAWDKIDKRYEANAE